MSIEGLRVYVIERKEITPPGTPYSNRKHESVKTGPFPVLKISPYSTTDESGHMFLIQDGLKLRTVHEYYIEIATPLAEALE